MVEWGADFVWYFHYMPVGNDAVPQLMCTPEQREKMYHRIREYRKTKPIFAMDFRTMQNMWVDVLPGDGGISISMQTVMWIPACLSIIPTPISVT